MFGIQTPFEKQATVSPLIQGESETEASLEEQSAMVKRLVKKTGWQISLSVNIDKMIKESEDYIMPMVEKIVRENLVGFAEEKKAEG